MPVTIHSIKYYLNNSKFVLSIYFLAAILTALQQYFGNHYNNFLIFRAAFNHLLQHQNLYQYYPTQYYDQFLYAPPAAILLAPLNVLPLLPSMLIWNCFTISIVWLSIFKLPHLPHNSKIFIAWFILQEMIGSLQNLQTNHLLAGIMVLAFVCLENGKAFTGGIFNALGFFIKGYNGILVMLLPFYKPAFKTILLGISAFALIGISPALFVGFKALPQLYTDWFACLAADHKVNIGVSLIGFLYANFPINIEAYTLQIGGLIILLSVYAIVFFARTHNFGWRLFLVSYTLLFIILFNHAAEGNSHIIAILGIALWLFSRPLTRFEKGLAFFLFLVTMLGPTDLLPATIRNGIFTERVIKVIPEICIWLYMHLDLLKKQSPFERLQYA
jgi:Glycosyltransferase family 87